MSRRRVAITGLGAVSSLGTTAVETWSALCALNAAGVDPKAPAVRKAVDWLIRIQNADGGWGESCASYDNHTFVPAASTPSQTAWAISADSWASSNTCSK